MLTRPAVFVLWLAWRNSSEKPAWGGVRNQPEIGCFAHDSTCQLFRIANFRKCFETGFLSGCRDLDAGNILVSAMICAPSQGVVRGGTAVPHGAVSLFKSRKNRFSAAKSKQILRKSNLQSALRQAAPPELVAGSHHAKKQKAFNKYIFSRSVLRILPFDCGTGKIWLAARTPEKFRRSLAHR